MAEYTKVVYAASYSSLDAAESDYKSIIEIHRDMALTDYIDLALVDHQSDGKIKIVKKHESAPGVQSLEGGAIGLASGLLVAAFPAIVLTGGLVLGTTAAGAVVGALVGHGTKGISRADVREIGETLHTGEAALLLVAGINIEKDLEKAITQADKVLRKEMVADRKDLKEALREAEKQNA